ncbi:MAG: MarR family transcriptional regulator [Actinomycetota bacterium]|nr:MarR family transcriptional regulator [Actinomycetota bacterium]
MVVPPEGTNVLFDVWLVSRATFGVLDTALAASGLTADEFAIYSVLTSTDAMTPGELARWMSAPLTSMSSYIKRFESRGHITRIANPDDGRSYRIQLTAAGRATHRAAGKLFQPVLDRVEQSLDQPAPTVRDALQSLHRALLAE